MRQRLTWLYHRWCVFQPLLHSCTVLRSCSPLAHCFIYPHQLGARRTMTPVSQVAAPPGVHLRQATPDSTSFSSDLTYDSMRPIMRTMVRQRELVGADCMYTLRVIEAYSGGVLMHKQD